jgi:Flp pilus assembly protein TadG
MVEFALVLPLLLVLVFGIFEFGRAWNAYQVMTDAAREGARNMVVADPFVTQDSVTRTIKRALARASLDTTTATITLAGWRAGMGAPVTVAISYPYNFSIVGPLLKWTTSQSSITLRTTFVMRNE